MQKLELHYSNLLQGKFSLKKLNFLFVFQVNCPGCFLYGIPVVNRLYHHFKDSYSFLGLSTAFEDFGLNTYENTQLLLEKAELIGETKKALSQQGIKEYPQPIDFPVAMDKHAGNESEHQFLAEKLALRYPEYSGLEQHQQQSIIHAMKNHLKDQPLVSLTFSLNQLRGTPSFVVFNNNFEIVEEWFGHKPIQEFHSILEQLKNQFSD